MCKEDTYAVKYKDIFIPITLKLKGRELGRNMFEMFVGKRYVGNHWCTSCRNTSFDLKIYTTCEECIEPDASKKVTRALNILKPNGSKLRGDELKKVFIEEFEADMSHESLVIYAL